MLRYDRHVKRYKSDNAMEKRYIVAKRRSEQGKLIRRKYKNDIGVPYQLCKGYSLMLDGYSNTITTFTTDNWIMELKDNDNMENLVYHEHPTKEQLLEYFSQRIRVRKMTPNEAGKLMGLDDSDIEKINAYPFKTMAERNEALTNADKKELNRIKRESVSKTAKYKCYGNSIVMDVLVHLFRTMFLPNQPENKQPTQKSLFDI